jgi:hypothetical protein
MGTATKTSVLPVKDLQKAFLQAVLEKDAAFMQNNVHENFVFSSPRAAVLNKEGFIKHFALNPDLGFDIFHSSEEQVIIIDHTGVVNCLLQVRPLAQKEFWERVTFTFVSDGQQWWILAMHATFLP